MVTVQTFLLIYILGADRYLYANGAGPKQGGFPNFFLSTGVGAYGFYFGFRGGHATLIF